MVAKFEAHQRAGSPPAEEAAQNQSPPQRPDHIPEKFWNADKGEVNVEALAKSYAELEKARSSAKPADAKPADAKPAEGKPAEGAPDAAAATAVAAAGLDMGKLETEFAESGKLSDDSIAAFEKVGISRAHIDAYFEGQKALADRVIAEVHSVAGGEPEFKAMSAWAGANLSDAEIEAFNAAMNGGAAAARLAVQGLAARYAAENGKQGKVLGGSAGAASVGYASQAELTRDMRDPKYATDPAYRAKVEQKLSVTTAFWN
jgi:hypothetical protein